MSNDVTLPRVNGFILAGKIGSGSYADVYKAYRKDKVHEVVAIKCVEKKNLSTTALNNLISEIEILKKLNHEHIVELKDFSWNDTYIFLIMEFCSGGNLSTFIHTKQRLPERTCQKFLQQLALALKYLRERNISHLDLKPQNILLASKHCNILKIGDFGLAQSMSESDKSSAIKGSPLYMAPEIVLKKEYDARADIWSVGVILYECIFGKPPYSSKSFDELIVKIKLDKPIEIPSNSSISSKCENFLLKCLQRNVSDRLDFDSFFMHPFVDLKHAPQIDSVKKASVLLSEAVKLDQSGSLIEAFNSYDEALKYLVPVMEIEKNVVKRMELRKKITEYVHRMEVLKKKLKQEDPSNWEVEKLASLTNLKSYTSNFEVSISTELLNLTKATPQMSVAIEIAQSAELYEREGKYSIALEKYEMALGKLLELIQNEPKGRRKELLLEEINRWMERAEHLKSLLGDTSDKYAGCVGGIPEAEMERNCSIQ